MFKDVYLLPFFIIEGPNLPPIKDIIEEYLLEKGIQLIAVIDDPDSKDFKYFEKMLSKKITKPLKYIMFEIHYKVLTEV